MDNDEQGQKARQVKSSRVIIIEAPRFVIERKLAPEARRLLG